MRNGTSKACGVVVLVLAATSLATCARARQANPAEAAREPVVGLPCEGCELVFVGMPDEPSSTALLAAVGEPGEPMRLEGVVRDAAGEPVAGIVVYAYQTNAEGVYPPGETRHGRLRGWARTDADGRYRFETIRPGSYPSRTNPEHVHLHVIEPGCCTYYVDEVVFTDDPLFRETGTGRGGSGVVTPTRDADGRWVAVRDIVVGEGIPGHPGS